MAKNMVYKGSTDGTFQKVESWLVNASQTITKGNFLINSSAKASVAAASLAAKSIIGVSLHAITTGVAVTDTDRVLVDVNPNSIYEMDYTGSAPTQGSAYDLSDKITLNQGDTSPAAISVIAAPDTANTRCKVKVLDAYHLYAG
jgi:hypothetical protein